MKKIIFAVITLMAFAMLASCEKNDIVDITGKGSITDGGETGDHGALVKVELLECQFVKNIGVHGSETSASITVTTTSLWTGIFKLTYEDGFTEIAEKPYNSYLHFDLGNHLSASIPEINEVQKKNFPWLEEQRFALTEVRNILFSHSRATCDVITFKLKSGDRTFTAPELKTLPHKDAVLITKEATNITRAAQAYQMPCLIDITMSQTSAEDADMIYSWNMAVSESDKDQVVFEPRNPRVIKQGFLTVDMWEIHTLNTEQNKKHGEIEELLNSSITTEEQKELATRDNLSLIGTGSFKGSNSVLNFAYNLFTNKVTEAHALQVTFNYQGQSFTMDVPDEWTVKHEGIEKGNVTDGGFDYVTYTITYSQSCSGVLQNTATQTVIAKAEVNKVTERFYLKDFANGILTWVYERKNTVNTADDITDTITISSGLSVTVEDEITVTGNTLSLVFSQVNSGNWVKGSSLAVSGTYGKVRYAPAVLTNQYLYTPTLTNTVQFGKNDDFVYIVADGREVYPETVPETTINKSNPVERSISTINGYISKGYTVTYSITRGNFASANQLFTVRRPVTPALIDGNVILWVDETSIYKSKTSADKDIFMAAFAPNYGDTPTGVCELTIVNNAVQIVKNGNGTERRWDANGWNVNKATYLSQIWTLSEYIPAKLAVTQAGTQIQFLYTSYANPSMQEAFVMSGSIHGLNDPFKARYEPINVDGEMVVTLKGCKIK